MQATTNSSNIMRPSDHIRGLLSPLVLALGGLLLVQLIAALVLGLGGRDLTPAGSQGALLAFDRDAITRIRVDASDKNPLVLEKLDDAWILPGIGGFPASDYKVGELLGKLAGIEKRLPVATSKTAMKRFKVADDDYERRLVLEGTDGTIATLFLGDSPGFRRLFVRADREQAVYEAGIALSDASEKANDWTDKNYLHLKADDIQRLALQDAVLERKESSWVLTDAVEGETLDQEAVDDALLGIANLDFSAVIAGGEQNGQPQAQPERAIEIGLTSGETREYKLYKTGEREIWTLSVSDRPYIFDLANYTAEDLTGMKRAGLLVATEVPSAKEGELQAEQKDGGGAVIEHTPDADLENTAPPARQP